MSDEMKDVQHTHPYTGETFGQVYRRGPAVADGGDRRETDSEAEEMADVDHTPREGEGADDVWTRGRTADGPTDVPDDDVAHE
jgi:hypothetical protein